MKIRIGVVINKEIEAPDFIRPYLDKSKEWFDMSKEERRAYDEWYAEVCKEHTILDSGEWVIVEEIEEEEEFEPGRPILDQMALNP